VDEPRDTAPAPPEAETAGTPAARPQRHVGQVMWLAVAVVLLVGVVILVAQNTRHVRVGWIFGHSQISLVYLVLFAVILGWLLGIATGVLLRRRTRRAR
jgi:uncharacterized integral membrane protein